MMLGLILWNGRTQSGRLFLWCVCYYCTLGTYPVRPVLIVTQVSHMCLVEDWFSFLIVCIAYSNTVWSRQLRSRFLFSTSSISPCGIAQVCDAIMSYHQVVQGNKNQWQSSVMFVNIWNSTGQQLQRGNLFLALSFSWYPVMSLLICYRLCWLFKQQIRCFS